MNFSLSKPNFAKYFTPQTKHSIAITANDSITKKFPVLKDGPLEVTLFCHTQFDELAQLKNFNAATSLPMFYSSSVEMARTSGFMPAMTLCPTLKILPSLLLCSVDCLHY
jgi:hypothetical protein